MITSLDSIPTIVISYHVTNIGGCVVICLSVSSLCWETVAINFEIFNPICWYFFFDIHAFQGKEIGQCMERDEYVQLIKYFKNIPVPPFTNMV